MPMKPSVGNMYDWVTHTHSHLGGECPHRCSYCYVGRNRFGRADRYKGLIRILDHELRVDYGREKIIFIEHMNDLFAKQVPSSWIDEILGHCRQYQENEYVFQTKNPARAWAIFQDHNFPRNFIIGTTIETNRDMSRISTAPPPSNRACAITQFHEDRVRTFITIEPILDFDPETLATWIINAHPEFINIGADSKGCGLPEPSKDRIGWLIALLDKGGMVIRKKINLGRLA